jgi:hypothetical protein
MLSVICETSSRSDRRIISDYGDSEHLPLTSRNIPQASLPSGFIASRPDFFAVFGKVGKITCEVLNKKVNVMDLLNGNLLAFSCGAFALLQVARFAWDQ